MLRYGVTMKKRYGSKSEKQAAYRARKKAEKGLRSGEILVDTGAVDVRGEVSKALGEEKAREIDEEIAEGVEGAGSELPHGGEPSAPEAGSSPALRDETALVGRVSFEGLSETDQAFELSNPGYYTFGEVQEKRECMRCGKHFRTRLKLNRLCSPECKKEVLNELSTMGRL